MAAPTKDSESTANAIGACHRRLVVRRWFLKGWNRAWELGNRSCRVLFGGYRADVRLLDEKKVLIRDYTPEARRLFLSGITRCTTVEELQHEMDCIVDLIPDGHPLKVELLRKLKEQIGIVRDSIASHNTEARQPATENQHGN